MLTLRVHLQFDRVNDAISGKKRAGREESQEQRVLLFPSYIYEIGVLTYIT